MRKYRNFLALFVFLPSLTFSQGSFFGSPGDRYKEYSIQNTGNHWRVTNPAANPEGAREFLPNPVLQLEIPDLTGVTRAEVIIDYWGGHTHTLDRKFRINQGNWISLPYSAGTGDEPWIYFFEFNPVLEIPLSSLKEGVNYFEGTCGHVNDNTENGWNWGQWGWYGITVRLYYAPEEDLKARILFPLQGDTLSEDQAVRMEYSLPGEVVQTEVFAWFDGYDDNGNGHFLDWHGFMHYDTITGNACTIYEPNNTGVWNTRWIPEQSGVKLVARVLNKEGFWHVTDKVEDLTVWQPEYKVEMFAQKDAPGHLIRDQYRSSGMIRLPGIKNAESALLGIRTWNGHNHGDLRWLSLNCSVIPQYGRDHNYYLHFSGIDPGILSAGDNVFLYDSQTHHHGVEILWPGPVLLLKINKNQD